MLTMRVTPYLHRDDVEAQLMTGISEIEDKLEVADTSGDKEQLETELEQLRASLDATRAEMAAQRKQALADRHGGGISFVPSAKNSICSRLMASFTDLKSGGEVEILKLLERHKNPLQSHLLTHMEYINSSEIASVMIANMDVTCGCSSFKTRDSVKRTYLLYKVFKQYFKTESRFQAHFLLSTVIELS